MSTLTAPVRPVAPPTPAARIPTWRLAATSFVPQHHRALTQRLLAVLPVVAILLLQAALSLRLHNVANSDEALYINAGHQYLTQFSGGAPAPTYYGGYFSGFPMAYPVFAGAVDSLGGLELVRFTSLLMMLGATLCIGSIAGHLADPRRHRPVSLAAMLFFVLTGPVLFVGHFATYDAACMSAVAAALALSIVKQGYGSALLAGLLVALAGVCKYSGAAFVPVIIVVALVSGTSLRRSTIRAALVATASVGGLLAVYLPSASFIKTGIEFTTANRSALNPRPLSYLLAEYGRGVGLLTALALLGLLYLWVSRPSPRSMVLGSTMFAAGLAIPVSQMRIHEYTSFNKHLTFAAIFLAPLAGQVLGTKGRLVKPLVLTVVVYLLTVMALYRSQFIFTEWPDSSPVTTAIQHADQPGAYLGVGAETMAYYSKNYPELTWEEPYVLFGAGQPFIKQAVDQEKYAGITYVSGTTGSVQLDANVAYLAQQLRNSPNYELVGSWPKHKYDQNRFFLYLRKPASMGTAGPTP